MKENENLEKYLSVVRKVRNIVGTLGVIPKSFGRIENPKYQNNPDDSIVKISLNTEENSDVLI